MSLRRVLVILLCFAILSPLVGRAASPVWKVTRPEGGTLYLGGSVHALRASDGGLPPAFASALGQSARLVFESSTEKLDDKKMREAGEYPRGDSLKNHVDPRTYAYLKRFFALIGVPEAKMARYRPWALTLFLWSPDNRGLSSDLGVESVLQKRARAQGKPVSGLVSAREHMDVFIGLTERQSEAALLLTFIPSPSSSYERTIKAWRRGDVDRLWKETSAGFADYPAFGERLLEARNRRWLPKIEGFLRSGQVYFVVVGSAHLGGPEGLLALLKQRGYRAEQL